MPKRLKQRVIINGEQYWITGDTYQELFDRAIELSGRKAPQQSTCGITLSEYAEKWLTLYKANVVKPNTLVAYKRRLRAYILPALGNREISSITTEDVQLFLNSWSRLSKKSLMDLKGLLSEIMKDAVDEGLAVKDPTDSRRIRIPSEKVMEREALPLEEFQCILRQMKELEGMDRRLMTLLMLTGMRRGEVLGLRWEDIDFEQRIIHVRRNVTHPGGNQPHIGTPKTAKGNRDLPLDLVVEEALQPVQNSGFIIGGEQPITLRTYTNTWERIKKKIDLHGATAHTFRHSYLTYMAGTECDLKTLQTIAGHSTISMTMNRYVHPQQKNLAAAENRVHQILFSGT